MKSLFLKLVLISAMLLLFPIATNAQYVKLQGIAGQGGQTLSGLSTTIKVQRTYPLCTVTIYNTGTATLSTIYADSVGTPKANPFTASSTAEWFFYAVSGRYDITFSGTGIVSPFTLSDVSINNLSSLSNRITLSATPTFDLAFNTLATDLLISHANVTVDANKTFSGIRISQSDGNFNTFTGGANSIVSNFGSFIKALSGTHATANTYATVIQADNAGAGTVKSLHVLTTATAGSTGVVTGASFDVAPVATNSNSFSVQIASSGANGLTRGIIYTTNGGNFTYGIDFLGYSTIPAYTGAAIRLPNDVVINARNAANSADVNLFRFNSGNRFEILTDSIVLNQANPYVQVGSDATGYLFQKVDSNDRWRLFKQGLANLKSGETIGIGASGVFYTTMGSNVASASSITPSGNTFTITGTTTISTISTTNIETGAILYIITQSAGLVFDEFGNIDITNATSLTSTANGLVIAVWDGTKWRMR